MDITFFEIHLDGAQFGPKTIGREMMDEFGKMGRTAETAETDEEATGEYGEYSEYDEGETDGRSRSASRFAPLFVLFAVGAGYVAYRRFRGGDDGVEPIDADAEAVEIAA